MSWGNRAVRGSSCSLGFEVIVGFSFIYGMGSSRVIKLIGLHKDLLLVGCFDYCY